MADVVHQHIDPAEPVQHRSRQFGDLSSIDVGAVVAEDCVIGRDCILKAEVKMWPHKKVENGATLSSSLVWGDKWSSTLFDAYGISGTANIEMTPEFATKLGVAYGASLPLGSTVLVSRDAHKTSRMIDRALMGLRRCEIDNAKYGAIRGWWHPDMALCAVI